jgi:hypothetical protein
MFFNVPPSPFSPETIDTQDTLTQDMKNYEPYKGDTNELTLNSEDSIYSDQGGEYGLLNLVSLGTDYSAGFLGSVTFGVEVDDDMSVSSSTSSGTSSCAASGSVVSSYATTTEDA